MGTDVLVYIYIHMCTYVYIWVCAVAVDVLVVRRMSVVCCLCVCWFVCCLVDVDGTLPGPFPCCELFWICLHLVFFVVLVACECVSACVH